MIAPRHLNSAPIKEALIDIRVLPLSSKSVSQLRVDIDDKDNKYSNIDEIKQGKIDIHFDKDEIVSGVTDESILGYKYVSNNKLHIVQFRIDGFTFSRLEPYDTWEQMRDEAARTWKIYLEAAKPEGIIRIATRYINVMRLPLPIKDFEDYLVTPPSLSKSLPQGVLSFLSRIVINDPKINTNAIITQAFETADDTHAPVTLDIDVFINQNYAPSDTSCWEHLENMRNFKNRIFFDSITDSTTELFQ